jgi:hypothetical protein
LNDDDPKKDLGIFFPFACILLLITELKTIQNSMLTKIISGGQTGAGRAAPDLAF